jgi:hypothetical protein
LIWGFSGPSLEPRRGRFRRHTFVLVGRVQGRHCGKGEGAAGEIEVEGAAGEIEVEGAAVEIEGEVKVSPLLLKKRECQIRKISTVQPTPSDDNQS